MPEFVFSMHNVRKKLGEKLVLDNVTLSFYEGAKIGVVGPNGAGKSTMLKLMAGMLRADNGDAMLAKGKTVGILLQEPPLTEDKTVMENVYEGGGRDQGDARPVQRDLDGHGRAGRGLRRPDRRDGRTCRPSSTTARPGTSTSQLEQAMDALQCPPGDSPVNILSGGERRRVALCKLLLQQPDLLLLDEPTNHLDAESVNWLEGHLKAYPGAVLAVTHDRYFLDNVAQWICEIDRGQLHPYEGNYSTYLETKKAPPADRGQEGRQAGQDPGARAGVGAGSNPKARQAKSRARLARYEEMAAEADRNR